MSDATSSIGTLPVKFLEIVKKHISEKTKRIHYKVRAALTTGKGVRKVEYWFGDHRSFLRQKHKSTGKTSIKVDYNSKQRAQIKKLVTAFEAHSK